MNFNWKNGCSQVKEYNEIIRAMQTISNSIYIPSLGGFSENGEVFCTVDLISEPKEIKELAQILKDFADSI